MSQKRGLGTGGGNRGPGRIRGGDGSDRGVLGPSFEARHARNSPAPASCGARWGAAEGGRTCHLANWLILRGEKGRWWENANPNQQPASADWAMGSLGPVLFPCLLKR
jgi:hypothetical protein